MSKETRKAKYDNKTKESGKFDSILLVPIFFLTMIYPLLMKYHTYHPDLDDQNFYIKGFEWTDIFLWIKQQSLIIVGFFLLCILLYMIIKNRKEISRYKVLIFLVVYVFLAILSTIFGGHATYGLTGGLDMFESLWILITYAIVASFFYMAIGTERILRITLKSITLGSIPVALIGCFQTWGIDFWMSNLGKQIIIGDNSINIKPSFSDGTAYSSLFNPNYVGTYVIMIMCVILYLLTIETKITWRILLSTTLILNLIMLYGARSSAGIIVAVFIMVGWLLYFLINKVKVSLKIVSISCGVVIAIGLVIVAVPFSRDIVLNKLSSNPNPDFSLENICTTEDGIRFTIDNEIIQATWTDSTQDLHFYDESGNDIPYQIGSDAHTLTISVPNNNESIPVTIIQDEDKDYGITITVQEKAFSFVYVAKSEKYYFLNEFGKKVSLLNHTTTFWKHDGLFTMRGYIWRHSLDAMKKTLLLGKGADSFIFQYDSDDYVGNAKMGFTGQIMTKPHNLFIQVWTQTGFLSLLCFILFYICILIKIMKSNDAVFKAFGLTVILGFALISLVNDSNLCTTPMFMIVTGCILAKLKLLDAKATIKQGDAINEK